MVLVSKMAGGLLAKRGLRRRADGDGVCTKTDLPRSIVSCVSVFLLFMSATLCNLLEKNCTFVRGNFAGIGRVTAFEGRCPGVHFRGGTQVFRVGDAGSMEFPPLSVLTPE